MNRNPFGQSFSLCTGALLASVAAVSFGWADLPDQKEGQAKSKPAATQKDSAKDSGKGKGDKDKYWKPLKGKWKACQFGGDGPVEIKNGVIQIGLGDPLTGVHWEGDVVRENFEVELEARRTDGFDFFCGLTFPVGKGQVSFILGGWGGGIVGISSVDGRDASDNETTSFRNFDNDKWYRVRARVDAHQIQCWIDGKPVCEQIRKGHEFDIRYEMDPCVPLGLAAFQCDAEYRNIRLRKLTKKEIDQAKELAAKEDDQ